MSKQAIYANIGAAYGQLALLFADLAVASNAHNVVTGVDGISAPVGEPSAAEVFNAPVAEAIAAFSTPVGYVEPQAAVLPVTPAAAPVDAITYTMLPAANGYSREDLCSQGWTDDLLVSNGLMTISVPAPKPPAVPTMPTAPTPSATTTPVATEPGGNPPYLDTTGLPWDTRIHSGGRTQTAKGEWVKKKGVQPNVTAQVTAELRQNPPKAASAPQQAAHVPLAPPAAVAAPTPVPVPPAPATAGPTNAQDLMQWVSTGGHGPNMAMVGQLMGFGSFSEALKPENAHRIAEAYGHFVTLKG